MYFHVFKENPELELLPFDIGLLTGMLHVSYFDTLV